MRGLKAATLFAVPALAGPIASVYNSAATHTKSVTLPIPDGEDGFEIVTLHLGVRPTKVLCGPCLLTVEGEQLRLNDFGYGSGTLQLESGRSISVEWHRSCVDTAQIVDMAVTSFDGELIPTVSLSTRVENEASSFEERLHVGDPQVDDGPIPPHALSAMHEAEREELMSEKHMLEQLRVKASELETLIKAQEADGIEDSSEGDSAHSIGVEKFGDCDTLRCVWQHLKDKIHSTKISLSHHMHGSHKGDGQFETTMQAGWHPHEKPLLKQSLVFDSDGSDEQYEIVDYGHSMNESPQEALIGALLLALVAFSIFSSLSLLYTNRDRIRTALAERRARRRNNWFTARAERRAAREKRKQAIRDFFRRLFRSLVDYDAEKRAAEEERRTELAEQQQRQSQPEVAQTNTTMEQELAGFRAAAAMVGDLVAAEEGRAQRRQMPQQQTHQAPPVPPRPAMPGFVTYDDVLPTYEDQVSESAVVADGFRYAPTAPAPPTFSRSLSVNESSSDRLGYNK